MIRSTLPRLRPEKTAMLPGGPSCSRCRKSGPAIEPPISGRLRLLVVPGDATEIVDQVGAERRMNPHERRQPRIHLPLYQRGVKMTGIDDNKTGVGHGGQATPVIIG